MIGKLVFLEHQTMADDKEPQSMTFRCNICDQTNNALTAKLTREEISCSRCGSTVRMRSIIQVLTKELFGSSLAISQITPPRPDIVGIGMSCWDGYALPLAHRIAFKNTYYHQEPRLDITSIDESLVGTLDFVVSSDVFEHVLAPIERAFVNVRRLLKPDGVFVLTVPYFHPGEDHVITTENFSELYEFDIVPHYLGPMLRNVKANGDVQYFHDLVFHGGPGQTLEMRRFSEWSVLNELVKAGFNDITVHRGDEIEHGITWPLKHSAPISARSRAGHAWAHPKIAFIDRPDWG